ncbi:MAG TPA: dTDP-4-dehydrorhamnose 3,5-epimerase [Steroidobacteraceae bacterium]|nr:dTDP-4-dehydrorhamnose 3,5-epimerase [Steroidobacteraceae bacterium]
MQFHPLDIPGVVLVEPTVFGDDRGFFLESWERAKFARADIDVDFVQDNHSRSVQYTLRGLHYQIQQPQGKLVRVVSGRVFDVVVDLRRSSPSFGKWVGAELSQDNKHMLWVPPGLAHGFVVLSEAADFVYKCTDYYAPHAERCIRWDDAQLGIQWKLPAGAAPLLSARDSAGVPFAQAEYFP